VEAPPTKETASVSPENLVTEAVVVAASADATAEIAREESEEALEAVKEFEQWQTQTLFSQGEQLIQTNQELQSLKSLTQTMMETLMTIKDNLLIQPPQSSQSEAVLPVAEIKPEIPTSEATQETPPPETKPESQSKKRNWL
jgi:hypothetical protein